MVTNGGSAQSATNFTFPVPPPAPTLSSFSPAVATSGTQVIIRGTNFTGATQVSFGGTPAQSFTVQSATEIRAFVGAGASGAVTVITPSGNASKTGFTYLANPLPSITSFSPTSASVGQTVTILGTYFTGATQVFMGNTSVPFTLHHSGRITVVVPSNAASGVIQVVTPTGIAARPGFTFVPTLLLATNTSNDEQSAVLAGIAAATIAQEQPASMLLKTYPNPVAQSLMVEAVLEEAGTLRLQMTNALGVVVWQQELPAQQRGTLQQNITVEHLPSGSYALTLLSAKRRAVAHFVKH